MSIENGASKFLHSSGVLCVVKTTYRSSGAEAPSRFDAMTYCSSGARVCLLSMVLGSSTLNPGTHSDSRIRSTSTSIFSTEPMLHTPLLPKNVSHSHQIQDIDNAIPVHIWCIFSKSTGNRHQIQNVHNTVLIDIMSIGCSF